jgi:MscS family membrane protein
VANITVTYDTSPEKIQRAIDIIKEILNEHEGMDAEFPPRVYFSDFNDWALNILVIYWYHPAEYWDYLAFSERVNFQILERFNAEGIEFAFPSQSLYLHPQESD